LSAVYTYFDPQFEKLSLGTYAILKQMQLAENTGRKYVYLGLYVAENQHLNYKARFTPQERLIDGRWVTFE
jgi:arginine-tRNA-protein transferase